MSIRESIPEDRIHIHEISKEDKDPVLEYQLIEKRPIEKVDFFGLRIDNFISRNELIARIIDLTKSPGQHVVIGIDPHKAMHARAYLTLKRHVNKATYVFAAGGGMMWSSAKIYRPLHTWIDPISLIIDIVRVSEALEIPIFFLGSKQEIIDQAYFNLKKSFPNMRVFGRHAGYFEREREQDVIEAIRKTGARILFVGMGFECELKWIYKNKAQFKNLILIPVGGSFDIIAGQKRGIPASFVNNGTRWLYRILTRPYRIVAWWRLLLFLILTQYYHFFVKPRRRRP